MNSAVRSPILFLAVALALPLAAQTEAGFAPSESAGLAQTADVHSVVPDLLQQQKQIWTFPAQAVKGKHLVPVLAVLGVTGALIATDSQTAAYFRGNKTYSSFNNAFSSTATAAAIVAVPAAFYGYGFVTHDTTAKSTAWLAGEALADSELLGYVMKTIDQRRTPGDFKNPHANFSDNWLDAGGSALGGNGSFPSGHTLGAFSVAAVVSRRYGRQHRWVPFLAYGCAAAVGFSRMSTSAHYPADVFMGGVLGYSISRFVVLHE